MPNLKSMEAARRGWAVFNAQTPHPSCEDINSELGPAGLPSISDRMYTHYRRLERYGRQDYIPINELDVSVKSRGRDV